MTFKKLSRPRTAIVLVSILLAAALLAGCNTTSAGTSTGQKIQANAEKQFKIGNYTNASKLYLEAQAQLQKEGKTDEAELCREKAQTCELLVATYSLTQTQLKALLAKEFPTVPIARRNKWISSGQLEHITVDGSTHYFGDIVGNIKYRNLDLFVQDAKLSGAYNQILLMLNDQIIPANPAQPNHPYLNPVTYNGNGVLSVPRKELPQTGTMKLWFPLGINEGPQQAASAGAVTPAGYLKLPPSTSQDIGLAYMEVPLDQLKTGLNVATPFTFTRYEERFIVDPNNVGAYDTTSPLFKQYTKSYGNIEITPTIKAKAQKVVGSEKNPYKEAQRLYYYVANNVKYSHMPHPVLWPRGQSESSYVHQHLYGDCGAQSMYYSALARSLGIPTRTTGGFQLFSGQFSGHFWAEFYLPNYGWVPVDTSVGQIANYCPTATAQQRKTFEDFYFGNLDNMRCVVQTDVDLPLIPPAQETPFMEIAIQMPAVNCATMPGVPGATLSDFYQLQRLP